MFTDVFYLNLSEEQNARLHEVGVRSKEVVDKSVDETIVYLEKFPMYRDFTKMATFDFENIIKTVPYNIKSTFVYEFNRLIELYSKDLNLSKNEVNYPKNVDGFFKFWGDKFIKNGNNLRMETIKIIRKTKGQAINENFSFGLNIDGSLESLFAEHF